ncbi:PEF-CTERM sorting domain-containing protein [Methanococcoides burtonii]|uniref:Methanol dehydrogenase beta subunit-like protein n=1 Tax=Methanococcoides burtonii (strain DSM 6242 / NBRC 107633 / OCM 468 / ACE-M) TaxID=259564 RepID=Q12XZ7_METBU|nr:PEF-CTERM sorting domain-containing protein [Methanococcoides burtonii]ABE51679.1 Methanol dehydrogenase beta subunit-like protein [Methanococcoides burtonii DSM 6242]
MKSKILIYLLVAIIATAGTAMAYDGNLYNAAGTAAAPNPMIIQPGETVTLSYYMENMNPADLNKTFPYSYSVVVKSGTGSPSDIAVTVPASVIPTTNPYTDVGIITVTKDINAPMDTVYTIKVVAGDSSVEVDSASRTIEVPEFPTIALPVAAIIGLAFFLQRRKEE